MRGTAKYTTGGLSKKDLKYNKYGKIISKNKSNLYRKLYIGGSEGNQPNAPTNAPQISERDCFLLARDGVSQTCRFRQVPY